MNGSLRRYLLCFAHEHEDFWLSEIKALSSLFKIQMKWVEEPTEKPFWIVDLPSEESAHKIASRSVCLRGILELWGYAPTTALLHQQLKALPRDFVKKYCSSNLSFKIKVETFCNSQTQREKLEKIESFAYLPFQGPVKLKNPDVVFKYVEYFGLNPNRIPPKPHQVFFGRVVCEGQRELINKINLKERKFIGNTTMDPHLSLLMANQAKVKNGDLVFDPFVGTGSLLVAAACFGGYGIGADIDYLILHAKTKPTRKKDRMTGRQQDESIRANFAQYNLQHRYLDVVVTDSSMPLWKPGFKLDAIITDPPYGIREATERIGSLKKDFQLAEEYLATHIPSKIVYEMGQLLKDLLCFSATHLTVGGRLVTWIPIYREEYDIKVLPSHPCLTLVGNSEQILSKFVSRRLLTFEKHKDVQDESEHKKVFAVGIKNFRQKYFAQIEKLKRENEAKQLEQKKLKERQH